MNTLITWNNKIGANVQSILQPILQPRETKQSSINKFPLILFLVTSLLFVAILFIRKSNAFINPQFWAEDGETFFAQMYNYGMHSLIMPYSNYLQFINRITALFAGLFPYKWSPTIFNYSTLVWSLLVIGRLFSPRVKLPHKPLLALTIVLVPSFGEVYMNLTNVIWIMALIFPLLIIQESAKTKLQLLGDIFTLTLISLTGIYVVIALPFFVYKAWRTRNNNDYFILFLALIYTLIQLAYYFSTIRHHQAILSALYIKEMIETFGLRLFGELFVGIKFDMAWNPYVLVILSLLLPFFIMYLNHNSKNRFAIIVLLLFTYIIFILSIYRTAKGGVPYWGHVDGDRYTFIPYVLIIWSLLCTINLKSYKSIIASVLVVLALVSSFESFTMKPYKNLHWSYYSQQISPCRFIQIPINPVPWHMILLPKKQDC